ncbi:Na/Pi cotransporter family protein [bacterium]|nr:Na/Pi cotransporter family protein [bacterium]
MDATIVTVLGGLGMFLLGIHHLTEGLKGLAGDSLRQALQRLVGGRFSAVLSGVVFTVLIQSSTAATLTVIGFVSAGLVTFPQAVGVIVGATLGTTSTPWIVAIFGLRLRIASAAMPLLGIGALLWLVGRGRWRSLGAILAGFGLLFVGIDYLQNGMAGTSWDLEAFAGSGPAARWILAIVGMVMTFVMQSSSAAAATTLVALDAGSLSFQQGCAIIVGQSVGSAATTAIAAVGGGLAVRRSALAHVVFSLVVGVLSLSFLTPLTTAAEWIGGRLGATDGVLALASFSSLFKLAGILVFYPWLDQFARYIEHLTGPGRDTAVDRLQPTLAEAGGTVALEAAWRALLETATGVVDALRRRLAGEPVAYAPAADAVRRTEQFLTSLSLETTDLTTIGPRLVRLCHALDHLGELDAELARAPATPADWSPPAGFAAAARALAELLDATRDPAGAPSPAAFRAVENASRQLGEERRSGREQLLADLALQRVSATNARGALDALAWADGALHHAWRLAESLRAAAR